MDAFFTLEGWIALLTMFCLELVLGIDNIIFISILSARLPKEEQGKARTLGLSLAVLTRIGLLLSLSWVMSLKNPLFTLFNNQVSGKDLILLFGGLFLIAKSTHEIHQKLEVEETGTMIASKRRFSGVILQILILDLVFSLDSVITAVGMANQIAIMVTAVIASTGVMVFTSGSISDFVDRHPTIKILALSFLILIGVTLMAEGLGQHISKGYIYFAMGFSFFVEMINLQVRKKSQPVQLHKGI